MKYYQKYCILISLLFVVMYCDIINKKQNNNKLIYILLDLSDSTKKPEIRESYFNNLKFIMKKVVPGDILIAGVITQKSISELNFCIQYEFPKFVPTTDNPLYKKAERKKFDKNFQSLKDSLNTVAESTIKNYQKMILRTEIIGALQTAERVFKSYDLPKNILVFMSDMFEDSNFYRFKNENLTKRRLASIINNEQKIGRLPDLTGVKVYVTGAVARNSQKYFQVRDFWCEYLKVCGANLATENYGSNLIRFNE